MINMVPWLTPLQVPVCQAVTASALASATISNALLRGPWVRASERASMLAVETEQSRRLRAEAKMVLA